MPRRSPRPLPLPQRVGAAGSREAGRQDVEAAADLGDVATATESSMRPIATDDSSVAVTKVPAPWRMESRPVWTVMRDRVVPGQDEPAARARAQAYFDRMREAYSEREHLRRPPSELFPPSFRDATDNAADSVAADSVAGQD